MPLPWERWLAKQDGEGFLLPLSGREVFLCPLPAPFSIFSHDIFFQVVDFKGEHRIGAHLFADLLD